MELNATRWWSELGPLVYASVAIMLLAVGLHGNHVFLQNDYFTKLIWSTPQGTCSLTHSLTYLLTYLLIYLQRIYC